MQRLAANAEQRRFGLSCNNNQSRGPNRLSRPGLDCSGVSRILFPLSRLAIIYLTRVNACPAQQLRVRLIPEDSSRFRGNVSGQLVPLLCLAPHGVYRAIPLAQGSGGLLPRLFTLTQH
jgi:hypothetical protein